jgi:hypothetical protein
MRTQLSEMNLVFTSVGRRVQLLREFRGAIERMRPSQSWRFEQLDAEPLPFPLCIGNLLGVVSRPKLAVRGGEVSRFLVRREWRKPRAS